jgi:hypothetical protein
LHATRIVERLARNVQPFDVLANNLQQATVIAADAEPAGRLRQRRGLLRWAGRQREIATPFAAARSMNARSSSLMGIVILRPL